MEVAGDVVSGILHVQKRGFHSWPQYYKKEIEKKENKNWKLFI